MGAFKIQTDLDLSGFNLLNFCIQSYTDLANVPNLGLGRKLFFTGNSTDKKNLREVIWDGDKWKAAVYLDDIEALTNGEGSLGTRVKALEDMLKMDDANDVINTWAEIQAFLDQVQEGTDLMTMLDGKLDKTGGTLSVSGYDGLTIASSVAGAAIKFKGTEATKGGYLVYSGGVDWLVSDDGWSTAFKLLHEGNVGEYKAGDSAKLNGLDASKYARYDTAIYLNKSYVNFIGYGTMDGGFPENGGVVSAGVNGYTMVLHGRNGVFRFNTFENGTATGWKTIAFTDSTVKAAYKLKNPSTDGDVVTITEEGRALINLSSARLDRQLSIGNGGVYVSTTLNASPALGSVGSNSLLVGASAYGMQHWVLGDGQGNIQVGRFDGTATAYALNLNPLGGAVNVGEGGLNVATTLKVGASDGTSSATIYMQRNSGNYIWANNAGGSIAFGVKDVGNPAFNTASLAIFSDRITSGTRNNEVSLGLASYRWSNVYSVGGNFSGRVLIGGVVDDGTSLLQIGDESASPFRISSSGSLVYSINLTGGWNRGLYFRNKDKNLLASISAYGNGESLRYLYIGTDAYSTSKRWFDINSTESNFNVLTKFNAGALIPTGQTLTIGSVTFRETAEGEVEVDGNLHATGTLASGGKATVGEGDNGGGGNANVYSDVLEGVITQEWEVGNPFQKEDVIVSLYMWNTDESRWEMVLADIGVTSENIWVTFGRPTSTSDKFMAVVMG